MQTATSKGNAEYLPCQVGAALDQAEDNLLALLGHGNELSSEDGDKLIARMERIAATMLRLVNPPSQETENVVHMYINELSKVVEAFAHQPDACILQAHSVISKMGWDI